MKTSTRTFSREDDLTDLLDDADAFIDERDWLLPGEIPDETPWGRDIFTSGAAHDVDVDAFEYETTIARRATAAQYACIADVLAEARTCPDPWCGPDRTTDPTWVDPRGRSAATVQAERREMAERAAVCDLAVRARLSETTIRTRGAAAAVLRTRCPRVWAAFISGDVDERNATTTAQLAQTLPDDDEGWRQFDDALAESAVRLAPGRFRTRARVVRERVHPESLDDRHARARENRGVWVDPAPDGMAFLQVCAPADQVQAAYARVDGFARHVHGRDDETRTLAQLRADVAVDLLNRGGADGTAGAAAGKPSVAVTVPVLSLLGAGDEPAVLHGYGPIDIRMARRLAGEASSWVRILTHPVSGTVLDVDRTVYRVPKALRRWLGVRDGVCTFPGCGRLATDCEMDHKREWQHGGATRASNLGPLCTSHHRVKTETLWTVGSGAGCDPGQTDAAPPGGARGGPGDTDRRSSLAHWSSPTGYEVDDDPPPW